MNPVYHFFLKYFLEIDKERRIRIIEMIKLTKKASS